MKRDTTLTIVFFVAACAIWAGLLSEPLPFLFVSIFTGKIASDNEDQQLRDWILGARVTDWLLVAVGVSQFYIYTKQAAILAEQTRITREQNGIIQSQANQAAEAFLADHRPELRVRHVNLLDLGEGMLGPWGSGLVNREEITGSLVVVNLGRLPARIIDARYRVFFTREDGLPMNIDFSEDDQFIPSGEWLPVGQPSGFPILGRVNFGRQLDPDAIHLNEFRPPWRVYVMGQIQYRDRAQRVRFLGFCRCVKAGELGGFRPVDNPDYEYQD